MAESNPLVATVDTGSWTGTANTVPLTTQEGKDKGKFSTGALSKDTEGGGLFSDAASTIGDAASGNWGGLAVDAVGDGMDALGMAMDPLGSLAGAGIGWLIEHIGFLKKSLDVLAGDPDAVTAKSQTWANVAKSLSDAAGQYQQSAGTMTSANQGAAVSGAGATGNNLAAVLKGASQHASDASDAMKYAGIAVGTTRGIIRDTLSQFAGDALVKWIAATVAAFFTFGATEAAFIVDEVVEGTSLALENAGKISKLVQMLEKFKSGAKDSESALKNTTEDIAKDAKTADKVGAEAKTADTAAKDAGRTAPSDASGGSHAAASTADGGAPKVSETGTAPSGTHGGTGTSGAEHAGGAPSAHGGEPTAPHDAGGGTTSPSGASPGHAAKEEPPSHEDVQQHVADHKQAVAEHNQRVDEHNAKTEDLKRQTEEHNQKAVDNQQARAANDKALKANQQNIDRARAQGKPHDSLNAQHRDLTGTQKSLKAEDASLAKRQEELTAQQKDLHQKGGDLNAEATKLHENQTHLVKEKGEDIEHRVGLQSDRFEHNKVIHSLQKVHEVWEGPHGSELGDKLKEPFAQGLSDQQTRGEDVRYESETKQEEWAKEHGGESGPSGGEGANAGGSADATGRASTPAAAPQPAWPTEHAG